jgi:hypothetical protein
MATFIQGVTDILPEQSLYKPDFAFIDKMMQRKSAMYEQGFQQLNNQYNLINRELTNPTNVKNRDQFLVAAKDNLKDLSSMDLSDMANVKSASSVFKPFWENSLLLEDQALTEFWKQQEGIADGYKNKDGGKEFFEKNLTYVKLQRAEFAKDDPTSVGRYSANRRSYTPYTDWRKHMEDALKDFKASHTKIDKKDGYYKRTSENESWTEEELTAYLKGALSDKDKQQMRIEAAVDFYGQTDVLAKALQASHEVKIPALTSLIDKYDTEIKLEKDATKLASLKQQREYYDTERARRTDELKKIQGGDLNFIKQNEEGLAYGFYLDNVVGDIARSRAHENWSETYSGDDVEKMFYEQYWDNHWKTIEYKYKDQDRADSWYKWFAEQKTKEGTPSTPIASANPLTSDVDYTLSGMNNQMSGLSDQRNSVIKDMMENVMNTPDAKRLNLSMSDVNSTDPNKQAQITALFKMYAINNPNNEFVMKFNNLSTDIENIQNFIDADMKSGEEALERGMGKQDYINYRRILEGKNTDLLGKPMSPATILQLQSSANTILTNHVDATVRQRKQSFSGMTLPNTDDTYKKVMSYFATAFKEAQTSGVTFLPSPLSSTGMNISLGITDDKLLAALKDDSGGTTFEGQTKTDLLENYANKFTPGTPVIFDTKTNQLIFKGNLGNTIAREVDPYNNVPSIHRSTLSTLSSFPLNPGQSTGRIKLSGRNVDAIDGKSRLIQLQDKMPESGGSRITKLFIDNFQIQQNFNSPYEAQQFANYLLGQKNYSIDAMINQEIK